MACNKDRHKCTSSSKLDWERYEAQLWSNKKSSDLETEVEVHVP